MSQKSSTVFIEREIYPEIWRWIKEPEILAIAGPRQAGKTTLLLKLKKELESSHPTVFINFEDSEQLLNFQKSPQDFIRLHLDPGPRTVFLLDEFQYVKNAGKLLKLLYDEYPQAKFIITGSASLKIRQIASYLVGRVIFFNLFPLSFAEFLAYKDRIVFRLWQDFHLRLLDHLGGKPIKLPQLIYGEKLERYLEEYLIYGGYPAVVLSEGEKKQARLAALVETYIEKDVVKFLQIGNFLEFKNLTKLLATQIGNLLTYSSVSQDTGLTFREVKKFLGVLEKTFVVKLLPPFHTNRATEIKKSPKSFFIDLGLRNSLISDFRSIDLRQDRGALLENFVLQNLLFRPATQSLHFWRTKQGAEVDFILDYQNEIVPIEVKFQTLAKARIPRGISSFLTAYQRPRGVVLTKNYASFQIANQERLLFLPAYFV